MENMATEHNLALDLWAEESGANIAADGCCTNSASTAGTAGTFGCPLGTFGSGGTAGTASTSC